MRDSSPEPVHGGMSGKKPVLPGEVLRPASDIIARRLGESAVLIRLQTNHIYELNETGAQIWDVLKTGKTRSDVIEALLPEFDIDREVLGNAVDELIGLLRAEGLI